jgi:lipopolysaccharide transport system permease protein
VASEVSLEGTPIDTAELPLTLYTPAPALRAPIRLLRDMARDLLAARELGWRLFVRDLSAQFRQSLLGVTWAFLPPLLTGLLFIALQSQRVLDFGPTEIPYPVFVLIGTTYWQVFVDALNAPLKSVTAAKPILVRIHFPHEALILSSLYLVLFNALLKVVVLVGVFVYFDVQMTTGLLLAPVAVALLILLGLAIGLALTPIGLLYTDVASGLVVATQLWFFATPIVYPPPSSFPLSLLATWNPVSPLLSTARELTASGSIADPVAFLCVGFAAAWIFYRIALPVLIERLGA